MRFQLKTKNDFPLFEVTSALQKSIRRSLEKDAMYWAMELEAKYHAYLWKRLTVIASEDIGLADNQMAILISSLKANYVEAKKKDRDERFLFVSHAILALCRSKKSREVDEFIHYYIIKHTELYHSPEKKTIPEFAYDKHTSKGKQKKRGMAHFWTEASQLVNEVKGSKYKKIVTDFYKNEPIPRKEESEKEEDQKNMFE